MPKGRQHRILRGLANGDLVWEVPGQQVFTQFDERTGKPVNIGLPTLEAMAAAGWIVRVSHSPERQKLDFWEITPAGRAQIKTLTSGASVSV